MWIGMMCEVLFAASVLQLAQPSLEKPPFRFLLREAEGPFVGSAGFRCLPQSAAEICPGRVGQVISSQIAPREDGIDERKTR